MSEATDWQFGGFSSKDAKPLNFQCDSEITNIQNSTSAKLDLSTEQWPILLLK